MDKGTVDYWNPLTRTSTENADSYVNSNITHGYRKMYTNLHSVLSKFKNNAVVVVNLNGEVRVYIGTNYGANLVYLSYALYLEVISRKIEIFVRKKGESMYLCGMRTSQSTTQTVDRIQVPVFHCDPKNSKLLHREIGFNKNACMTNTKTVKEECLKSDNVSNIVDSSLKENETTSSKEKSVLTPDGNEVQSNSDEPVVQTGSSNDSVDIFKYFAVLQKALRPLRDVHTIDELFAVQECFKHPIYGIEAARPLIPRTTEDLPYPVQASEDLQGAVRQWIRQRPHDLVRCYHCGIGLKDWSHQNNPLYEHIRYAPYCEHLVHTIEPELLGHYRSFLLPSLTEAGSGQIRSQTDPYGNNYRHPEYQSYEARVSSFAKWPSGIIQTPSQLAEAGFFYTGMQDVVRCFACDGGLRRWDPDNDPWIEHARWFPECVHVIQVIGMGYINRLAIDQDSEDEDNGGGIAVDLNHSQEINIVTGSQKPKEESDDPIYKSAAQSVIGLGYSRAAVEMAIKECNSKKLQLSSENIIVKLLDMEDRVEILPPQANFSETEHLHSESQNNTLSTRTAERAMSLEEENFKLASLAASKCCLCDEIDANVLFLPCGHVVMCSECAKDAAMCPICQDSIREKVGTFMA